MLAVEAAQRPMNPLEPALLHLYMPLMMHYSLLSNSSVSTPKLPVLKTFINISAIWMLGPLLLSLLVDIL